ncbi:MAG: YqiA/YcfP family alpha/beta fold hydrolase [Bryobacteraceae bacterium]
MLIPGLSVLYLHGFASSPLSRKARFLGERFVELGIRFDAPDLAAEDFFHLTISKQLEVVRAMAAGAGPLMIVGSSLGGYLAALYATEHREIEQLVLLAPAFGFHDLWVERLGPEELADWQRSGKLSVFHYGTGGQADLSYEFLRDAEKYPAYPDSRVPTLIFHGTHDDLVPVANSAWFAEEHSEARLITLNSGHELTDVLDDIWTGIKALFLSS